MYTDVRLALVLAVCCAVLERAVLPAELTTLLVWRLAVWGTAFCSTLGLLVYFFFYCHAVHTIFNCNPALKWTPLLALFKMTKPLELAWRYATARFR